MSSFEHSSLKGSVVDGVMDGLYDLVSRFADPGDDQSLVPGCASYSVLGPAPSVVGSSASRRGASVPCCGSSQQQAPARESIYAPAQTAYGPAPAANENKDRRASSQASRPRTAGGNDAIDQQVQQFVRKHPRLKGRVMWKSCGLYLFDGREIAVEWQRAGEMAGPSGILMVTDGPLRQPLSDYVENMHTTAVYDSASLRRSNLEQTSKETRMTFKDDEERYSRLDAMKVAKEQANFREKAAEYSRSGHSVPSDLLEKYEKTMDIKLGRQHMSKRFTSKTEQQRTNAGLQNHVPSFRAGGSHADPLPEPHVSSTPNVPSFSLFGTPSLSLNKLKGPEPNMFGAPNFMPTAGLQPPPGLKLAESNSQSRLDFGFQSIGGIPSRRGCPGGA